MTLLELAANGATTVSILLAARNSLHTWWTGIIGSLLFGLLFFNSQLLADALLQLFFIVTSLWGWYGWSRHGQHPPLPVRRSSPQLLALCVVGALLITGGCGLLLQRFTQAWAPFWDSAVLGLSVAGQLLLMQRRLACWWFWLAVNSLAVPLFASRGLLLTAGLYSLYWVNACYGWWRWRRELADALA